MARCILLSYVRNFVTLFVAINTFTTILSATGIESDHLNPALAIPYISEQINHGRHHPADGSAGPGSHHASSVPADEGECYTVQSRPSVLLGRNAETECRYRRGLGIWHDLFAGPCRGFCRYVFCPRSPWSLRRTGGILRVGTGEYTVLLRQAPHHLRIIERHPATIILARLGSTTSPQLRITNQGWMSNMPPLSDANTGMQMVKQHMPGDIVIGGVDEDTGVGLAAGGGRCRRPSRGSASGYALGDKVTFHFNHSSGTQ